MVVAEAGAHNMWGRVTEQCGNGRVNDTTIFDPNVSLIIFSTNIMLNMLLEVRITSYCAIFVRRACLMACVST